jgi:ornithine cyclodeaminase
LLNSTASGRPLALLEGSVINAQRTAASAALAARLLHPDPEVARMGMIGCGPIHREVVRYLRVSFPRLSEISICDIAPERAERFRRQAELDHRGLSVRIVPAAQDLLGSVALVSIATTASVPHLFDVASLPDGSTLLHLSVRDLAPEVVLACDNVVDDADHVCREQTSLHLTEQATGGRGFIRCTLADILLGKAPPRAHPGGLTVFTPFGLGVLDVALGKQVYDAAVAAGRGRWVPDFFAAG